MSYEFKIGKLIKDPTISQNDLDEGVYPWTAQMVFNAPGAPELDEDTSNAWRIGYVNFDRIVRASGLYRILPIKNGWFEPHPGYVKITPELVEAVEACRDAFAIGVTDLNLYTAKVLAWLAFWLRFSLENYGDDAVLLNT